MIVDVCGWAHCSVMRGGACAGQEADGRRTALVVAGARIITKVTEEGVMKVAVVCGTRRRERDGCGQ